MGNRRLSRVALWCAGAAVCCSLVVGAAGVSSAAAKPSVVRAKVNSHSRCNGVHHRCPRRRRPRPLEVATLGDNFHVFHLHGHRWEFRGRFDDSIVFGPASTLTFDYVEDNPGDWLYHCHVAMHMMGGMIGRYVVSA